jgi:hypothetical protein
MKKYLALLITLVFLLLTAACSNSGNDATTESNALTTAVSNETSANNVTTASNTSATTSTPAASSIAAPMTAEIIDAYQKAFKIYWAFNISQFILEWDVPAPSGTDGNYFKVRDYGTLLELRTYMETVLSTNLVNNLLNISPPVYQEIGGVLYGYELVTGSAGYGQETVAVVKNSDTQFTVTATIEVLDDNENVSAYEPHNSIYKLVNGKWVFTSFDFYR